MKTKPHICVRRSLLSGKFYTGILLGGMFAAIERTEERPGLTKYVITAAKLSWEDPSWFSGYSFMDVETPRAPD